MMYKSVVMRFNHSGSKLLFRSSNYKKVLYSRNHVNYSIALFILPNIVYHSNIKALSNNNIDYNPDSNRILAPRKMNSKQKLSFSDSFRSHFENLRKLIHNILQILYRSGYLAFIFSPW
jgi:hypothetical protein